MRRIVIVVAVIAAFTGEIFGQDNPTQPELISPEEGAENVLMDDDFTWFSDTNATEYEFQIATNPSFNTRLVDTTITDTVFTLQGGLDYNTEYRWRVRAVNDSMEGPYSETRSFSTVIEPPEIVQLSDPPNNDENASTRPTLSWNESERAETYELEVSTNVGFSEIVLDTSISSTEFIVENALSNDSTYYWRVKAHNEGGESEWSSEWNFNTMMEELNPVVLESPANNATDVDLMPEFEWQTMEEADSYDIQVATDNDFINLEIDETGIETTSYTSGDSLDYNSPYYWRVRAVNEDGPGEWSSEWNFTTMMDELNPVVLESPANNATVDLNPEFEWQPMEEADSYDIQVATDNDFTNLEVDESEIEATTFTAGESFENNTPYYWRVRAVNEDGESEWSSEWSFTTIMEQPGVVTLSAPSDNSTHVSNTPTLSWNSSENADSYELQLSSDSGFSQTIVDTAVSGLEYSVDNALSNGETYFWHVRAVNEDGESEWSEEWSFTTTVSEPETVDLIGPTNGSSDVDLNPEFEWESADGADTYDFQVATDNGFNNLVIDDSLINATAFTPNETLDNNTPYYWRVRGQNEGGAGSWSQTWNFTTIVELPETVQLSEPSDNEESVSTFPTMRWDIADRAESYELELSANEEFTDIEISTEVTNDEYSVNEALENESTYYWRVRAINAAGESGWSDEWSFTTIVDEPNAVSLESPGNGSTGLSLSPDFEWQSMESAESYAFQVSTDNGFNNLVIDESGLESTSFTPEESLDNNTQYYWRVRGENEAGTGSWSSIWNFTTIIAQPAVTQLSEPSNNVASISTFPTLRWQNADRAGSYHLELSNNSDFSDIIVDSVLTDTAYSVASALSRGSTYYWRVKTQNAAGESDWSDAWGFTTIQEPPTEIVELIAPENNAEDVSTQPTITWSSVPRAEAYLVEIAEENTFENLVFDSTFVSSDTSYDFEEELDSDKQYFWSVRALNDGGNADWSEVFSFTTGMGTSIEDEAAPVEYTLQQNYPNPFNPTTTIRYGIPEASEVQIEVYNVLGQRVAELVNERKSAGWHTVNFDASQLSSGMYIYRIQASNFVSTKKLMLIK